MDSFGSSKDCQMPFLNKLLLSMIKGWSLIAEAWLPKMELARVYQVWDSP